MAQTEPLGWDKVGRTNSEPQQKSYLRRDDIEVGSLGVCSTPEFLHLYRRTRSQWLKLRSLRVTIRAVSHELGTGLTGRLLELAQSDEPLDRQSDYKVDERLVTTWTEAVQALRADADAPLPSTRGAERDWEEDHGHRFNCVLNHSIQNTDAAERCNNAIGRGKRSEAKEDASRCSFP